MNSRTRRQFIQVAARLLAGLGIAVTVAEAAQSDPYVCPPCGCKADKQEFSEPGKCPACSMKLVRRSSLPPKKSS